MTQQVDVKSKTRWLKPEEWLKENPGLIGRDTFYQRLRDGGIPCVRVGRRILVREDVLDLMQAETGRADA
jgi:excisionase family DNA binding protein